MGNTLRSAVVLDLLARLRRLKQTAARADARIRFALGRRRRLAPLSDDQIRRYQRDGYLLAPDLIPPECVAAAVAAMWQLLGADPEKPETWRRLGPGPRVLKDRRLTATYTDALLGAAAQLAHEDVASFRRPGRAFTINNVPVSGEWRRHDPHLDRTNPAMRERTFPRPYRIGALTYLTDVMPGGGGTIVWPGSHRTVEALALSDPRRYRRLAALGAQLGRLDLQPPVELTPSRGDVLFHHYLCVHATSDNVRGTPRLAINHKW